MTRTMRIETKKNENYGQKKGKEKKKDFRK